MGMPEKHQGASTIPIERLSAARFPEKSTSYWKQSDAWRNRTTVDEPTLFTLCW